MDCSYRHNYPLSNPWLSFNFLQPELTIWEKMLPKGQKMPTVHSGTFPGPGELQYFKNQNVSLQ